jgi:hypothetical protein
VGEVAGAEQMNAFDPGPGGKTLQGAGLACRSGKGGMDVEISDVAHGFVVVKKEINRG